MPDESSVDPYLEQLFEDYSNTEVIELHQYLSEWDRGTYRTVAQSVLDHSQEKDLIHSNICVRHTISTLEVL